MAMLLRAYALTVGFTNVRKVLMIVVITTRQLKWNLRAGQGGERVLEVPENSAGPPENGFNKPRTPERTSGLRRSLWVSSGLLREDRISENPGVPGRD